MALPSKSQIDKLGDRLRHDPISPEDLALLQEYISAHSDAMVTVQEELALLFPDLTVTPRLKTRDTLVDKLRRMSTRLSSIQDVAGVRLSPVPNLQSQDEASARITAAFPNSRVVDRRANPSHGYRALHIIVMRSDRAVEVQVRTEAQDRWAQTMERIAFQWGRQTRYGKPPDNPRREAGRPYRRGVNRQKVWESMLRLSDLLPRMEELGEQIDSLRRPEDLDPTQAESYLEEATRLNEETAQLNADMEHLLAQLYGRE